MRCAATFRRRSRRDGATGRLARQTRRAAGGVREPAAGAGRVRKGFTATARGADRTQLRALLRHGGHAALPSAGAGEHSEAAVGARGSVQPESDSAKAAGSGHTAGAERSRGPDAFATLALSAVPNDHRFACPATYCRCWSAPRIIFPLPHVSSPLAEHQQFCHGLLSVPPSL